MFNSLLAEHKTPFGAVAAGEEMTLRFTLPQGDPRTPSLLLYRAGQPQPLLHTPLCRQGDAFTLRYTPQEPGLYYYGFRLSDGTLLHRAPDGSADYGEGQLWQLTVYDKAYDIPQKFAGQVMYQIFPDRYYNSGREKTGVPADRRLHRDWQEEPQSTPDADGVFRCNDYFGGDLAGITERLPELAALGVGVLYLNPIFEAHSNHRYNTADYLRIDPLLGTEQDFITLCQRAHEHGIKIILDGVFNHTGSDSLYFNKEGRYGPAAPTAIRAAPTAAGTAGRMPPPICTRAGGASRVSPSSTAGTRAGGNSSAEKTASCGTGCGWAPMAGGWMWWMNTPMSWYA